MLMIKIKNIGVKMEILNVFINVIRIYINSILLGILISIVFFIFRYC